MADLSEARDEIFYSLEDTTIQQAAVRDPSLIGLVLVARELGEQLDSIDSRLITISDMLAKIVDAIEALNPTAR